MRHSVAVVVMSCHCCSKLCCIPSQMAQAGYVQERSSSCDVGVYSSTIQGVDAFAADVQSVCDLFRAASRRSNSSFAGELNTKNASAMADLVSLRMEKLLSQHHGLAVPDQAPTPGKKLKKGSSAESSPGTSTEPGSSNEKTVNIIEDLARYSTHIKAGGCIIAYDAHVVLNDTACSLLKS